MGWLMSARRMSDRSTQFRAFVAPFAAFMLLLGAGQAVAALFRHSGSLLLAAPQYWIFPAQTILCGAMLWWFRSSYRLRKPEKIGLTIGIAVLVLAIWISPQTMLGFAHRTEGFDPTPFKNNRALYATVL